VSARVYAVVVGYNRRDETVAALRSLQSLEGLSGIVVVDNASMDGTASAVQEEFPDLELVRSPVNRGYGGGNNLGFARALELGADYVLVVNNDVEVANTRFLHELVSRLESRPSIGLAGPLVRLGDGSVQPTVERWPSFPLALRLALRRRFGRPKARAREGVVPAVNGVCFLVRRSLLEATGGFDERYFMYGEEADLAARGKAAGAAALFVPVESVVHHHPEGELRGESAEQIRVNFVRFCLDHRGPLSAGATAALFAAAAALRGLRRRNLGEARSLAGAFRDLLLPSRTPGGALLDFYELAVVPILIAVLLLLLGLGSSRVPSLRAVGSGGKFVALGALAMWLPAALLLDRRRALRTLSELRGAAVFLLLFVLFAAASITWSDAPAESRRFAVGLTLMFSAMIITPWRVAYGLRRPGLLVRAALAGVAAVVVGQMLALAVDRHGSLVTEAGVTRFRGFLESPNTIAAYVFVLPLAAWWLLRAGVWGRLVGVALMLVFLAEIAYSATRLALILIVVVLALYALSARFGGPYAVAAAALMIAAAVAVTVVAVEGYGEGRGGPSFLRPSTIPTLSGRTEAWQGAGKLIARRPLTGYGIGTEQTELSRYRSVADRTGATCENLALQPNPCDSPRARRARLADFSGDYFHNSFLGLGVQVGAVVASLWGVFFAVAVTRAGLVVPRSRNSLAAAVFASLPGGLVWAFYSTFLWNPGNVVTCLFWLLLALGMAQARWPAAATD